MFFIFSAICVEFCILRFQASFIAYPFIFFDDINIRFFWCIFNVKSTICLRFRTTILWLLGRPWRTKTEGEKSVKLLYSRFWFLIVPSSTNGSNTFQNQFWDWINSINEPSSLVTKELKWCGIADGEGFWGKKDDVDSLAKNDCWGDVYKVFGTESLKSGFENSRRSFCIRAIFFGAAKSVLSFTSVSGFDSILISSNSASWRLGKTLFFYAI